MEKASLKINDNGPIRVSGEVELVDAEGNAFTKKETFFLCRCGHSKNKPFCDGSHKAEAFDSSPRAK